jgi:diadenosine tetraphosphatase ApaH/serine/threonine PP2A family protein phosphatase
VSKQVPPTRLAVLYDVHGNLPALLAVLDDARAEGGERFLLGGDYALFGPCPDETVATLRALPDAIWIRGNVDRWTAGATDIPDDPLIHDAIAACREALGPQRATELGDLTERRTVDGTLYCHASPLSDLRSFRPEGSDDEEELLAGAGARRVVFGHTHLQFRRSRPDRIELVNPGSVGMPFDGDPRAAYAVVSPDGSLELRRVAYDHEASAAAMTDRFGDVAWARRSADRIRRASM